MDVEWDDRKAVANLKKHGVDFADAAAVLFDECAVTISADCTEEDRFVAVGTDALGRLVVVVYTWRGMNIRVISARRATRRERGQYEGE